MADEETLKIYAAKAGDYATRFHEASVSKQLREFLDGLPDNARILDLGCGPGRAAAAMKAEGHKVDAWDASPEMAKIGAEMYGIEIKTALFEALEVESVYDGIFANFSLLHAPKVEMPDHLDRIATALKPNGLFHIGLKAGTGETRDALGRFYAYYGANEIVGLLEAAGLDVKTRDFGEEAGLDGTIAPWIILKARKHD